MDRILTTLPGFVLGYFVGREFSGSVVVTVVVFIAAVILTYIVPKWR